jgi:hypothetical protein
MLRKFLIVASVVVGFTSSLVVDSMGGKKSNTLSGGEKSTYSNHELFQDTIVLDGKGDDYVLFCRRKFEIKSFTVIRDQFGMGIALGDVPVPCEALVVYFKKPGEDHTYITVSIEVRGIPTPQPE